MLAASAAMSGGAIAHDLTPEEQGNAVVGVVITIANQYKGQLSPQFVESLRAQVDENLRPTGKPIKTVKGTKDEEALGVMRILLVGELQRLKSTVKTADSVPAPR